MTMEIAKQLKNRITCLLMKDAFLFLLGRKYTNVFDKRPLYIPIARVLDHRISFDQVADSRIERVHRFEAGSFDLGIGDNIVPLIRILADRRVEKHEVGNLFLDMFSELSLRNVSIGQTDVVDLAFHLVEIGNATLEHARDVAHMYVITLEGTFK